MKLLKWLWRLLKEDADCKIAQRKMALSGNWNINQRHNGNQQWQVREWGDRVVQKCGEKVTPEGKT